MLTNPVALKIYSKLCEYPPSELRKRIDLVAKSAKLVYRKCGRNEARIFCRLIRAAMVG